MTVRTYWTWETTATLRLLGGARGAGAPTGGGEGRGHIVSPRGQLVISKRLHIGEPVSGRGMILNIQRVKKSRLSRPQQL